MRRVLRAGLQPTRKLKGKNVKTFLELGIDPVKLLTDKRGKVRDSLRLENNTTAVRRPGGIAVQLHGTDVVTFRDDGAVVLNSGGWDTMTTRDRLHRYAPGARVYRHDGKTRVAVGGRSFFFVDGFTYRPETGEVLTDPALLDELEARTELLKAAKKAARKWVRSMDADEARTLGDKLAASDFGGDCFYCLGRVSGAAHVALHLHERYYVPSLFVNSLRAKWGASAGRYAFAWVMDLQAGRTNHPARIVGAVAEWIGPELIAEGWPDVELH